MTIDKSWPTAERIEKAQAPGGFKRDWSCFDRSTCRHELMTGVTPLGVGQGDWNVMLCTACGHVEVQCNHDKFEWNAEGSLLRCKCCGLDGT
jgi:hypothetical protein